MPDPDDIHVFVDEAIGELPDKLRAPVVAHFLEGRTHQEIAEELGVPRSTITSRVARGIDEIRKHLRRKGVAVSVSALASLLTAESAQAAPAALVAALGKMALSCGASTAAGTAALTGGVLAMKASTWSIIAAGLFIAAAILVPIARYGIPRPNPDPGRTVGFELIALADADEVAVAAQREPIAATEVTAATEEGLRVAGLVVDSQGRPVEGARVKLYLGDDRTPKREVVTGENGAFAFGGMKPGTRFCCVAKKEGMVAVPGSGSWTELGNADIEEHRLPMYYAARIEGQVADSRGRMVPPGSVCARCLPAGCIVLMMETTDMDRSGAFVLDGLLPGQHSLAVLLDECEPNSRLDLQDLLIELQEGEQRAGIRLVIDVNAPFLAGRVLDEQGEPVASACVEVFLGRSYAFDERGQAGNPSGWGCARNLHRRTGILSPVAPTGGSLQDDYLEGRL